MLSGFLICLSLTSFLGSYFEITLLFSMNSLISLVGIVFCIIMLAITHSSASSVDSEISGGKCPFVLPQFSQVQLMERGCSGKYLSFSEQMENLSCKKVEIARIWEDNTNILVVDQKESFGCLNLQCCDQVKDIISSRFEVVQVACISMTMFLGLFIINLQYMSRSVSRY
jgi:hypothetical protein